MRTCLAVALVAVFCAEATNVDVKGTLICHKKRVNKVTVQLWERDRLDPNDLLSEVVVNDEGEFHITGNHTELFGDIEPFLQITHDCDAKPGCKRIAEYTIPPSQFNKLYDMTYVPLNIMTTNEQTVCK